MATAYQYDASGFFAGEVEDYGLLPNNATYTPPAMVEGYIQRWNSSTWELVENHKGETGFVDGIPHTITEYGPHPKGWSTTPPEPTEEEKKEEYKKTLMARLEALDRESIRPSRALANGTGTDEDRKKLLAIEEEATELRKELMA